MSSERPHIRVVDRRSRRGLGGAFTSVVTHTLCGAAATDLDVPYHDAAEIVRANCEVWPVCQACRTLYLEAKAEARHRRASASTSADLHGGEA